MYWNGIRFFFFLNLLQNHRMVEFRAILTILEFL